MLTCSIHLTEIRYTAYIRIIDNLVYRLQAILDCVYSFREYFILLAFGAKGPWPLKFHHSGLQLKLRELLPVPLIIGF